MQGDCPNCEQYKNRVRELEGRALHEPGCPAITDDESDQVLHDYQECACLARKLARAEATVAELRASVEMGDDYSQGQAETILELNATVERMREAVKHLLCWHEHRPLSTQLSHEQASELARAALASDPTAPATPSTPPGPTPAREKRP